jgi:hypothetical protein
MLLGSTSVKAAHRMLMKLTLALQKVPPSNSCQIGCVAKLFRTLISDLNDKTNDIGPVYWFDFISSLWVYEESDDFELFLSAIYDIKFHSFAYFNHNHGTPVWILSWLYNISVFCAFYIWN